MDIIVSHPGSPGTSFTDDVKNMIVLMNDELENKADFGSLADFRKHLESCGLNSNYARNILPFLQCCGIVKYNNITSFENKKIFTNIGHVFIDVLKSIKIAEGEPPSADRDAIVELLGKIQETIYFQCLVIMMKTPESKYATDFFDVLRFVHKYGHIDWTEYMLILFEREQNPTYFLENMADLVQHYRDGTESINVKGKTKNGDVVDAKGINSFPYVHGNFTKAGVFLEENNKFYIKEERRAEVECAIREVGLLWQNSVK